MTYDEFNRFCGALPATAHVMQWGGAHVWKVGGKVFAIGGWEAEAPAFSFPAFSFPGFSFKVSVIAYEALKDRPGVRPAPYLASRGMSWVQHFAAPGLRDDELEDHLRASHRLVATGLSKKRRAELRLVLE